MGKKFEVVGIVEIQCRYLVEADSEEEAAQKWIDDEDTEFIEELDGSADRKEIISIEPVI